MQNSDNMQSMMESNHFESYPDPKETNGGSDNSNSNDESSGQNTNDDTIAHLDGHGRIVIASIKRDKGKRIIMSDEAEKSEKE